MRYLLLFIFYLVSFSSFSQHDKFFSEISAAKNTDEKILFFVTYLDDIDSKSKNLDSLNSVFIELERAEPSIKYYIVFQRQLLKLQQEKNISTRISMYNKLAKKYVDEKQKIFEAVCYLQIAQQQLNLKQYSSSLNNALKANELFKQVQYQNIPEIGKYLHSVALIHFFFKDYEKVIALMKSSYKYPIYNKNIDIQRDNNIAQSLMGLGKNKQAREQFFKSLVKAQKYKDSTWIGIISGNLGDLYEREGAYDTSLKYYKYGFTFLSIKKYPGYTKIFCLKFLEEVCRLVISLQQKLLLMHTTL